MKKKLYECHVYEKPVTLRHRPKEDKRIAVDILPDTRTGAA